jgi:anhydro-N-acetylmuramic acid kinase
MQSIRILGVMTGTSCDGLDAACVQIDKTGHWKPIWTASAPYPKDLKKRVLEFQIPKTKTSVSEILVLNRDLGTWYGKTLKKMIEGRRSEEKPDLIANHGQTVAHFPDEEVTLQLGDPARIAQVTGVTVISHFRDGDMAAGGQGAPLLPLFHKILADQLKTSETHEGIAIHNLGGISNITYLGPSGSLYEVFAFDTGPANVWIDEAVTKVTRGKKNFDQSGKFAAQGKIDINAVKKTLKHPYFKKSVPKSTGRDDFPFSFFQKQTKARGNDLIATATAVTVESIARGYEDFILSNGLPLSAIYLAGGGAKNSTLVDWLQERMPSISIRLISEMEFQDSIKEEMIEPLGFALFGYFSLSGQPLGGTWTGVDGFGPPGQITPGENWQEIVSQLSDFFGQPAKTHSVRKLAVV